MVLRVRAFLAQLIRHGVRHKSKTRIATKVTPQVHVPLTRFVLVSDGLQPLEDFTMCLCEDMNFVKPGYRVKQSKVREGFQCRWVNCQIL